MERNKNEGKLVIGWYWPDFVDNPQHHLSCSHRKMNKLSSLGTSYCVNEKCFFRRQEYLKKPNLKTGDIIFPKLSVHVGKDGVFIVCQEKPQLAKIKE